MLYASRLAERLGRIDAAATARQLALLSGLRLPVSLPAGTWPPEELIARMRLDKKSESGRLRFVLPTRIGHVELVDGVEEPLVQEVLTNSPL